MIEIDLWWILTLTVFRFLFLQCKCTRAHHLTLIESIKHFTVSKFVTCTHLVLLCWKLHSVRDIKVKEKKKENINHIANRISTSIYTTSLFHSFSVSLFKWCQCVLIGVPWWQIRNNSCDKANIQANIQSIRIFCSVNSSWWFFFSLSNLVLCCDGAHTGRTFKWIFFSFSTSSSSC